MTTVGHAQTRLRGLRAGPVVAKHLQRVQKRCHRPGQFRVTTLEKRRAQRLARDNDYPAERSLSERRIVLRPQSDSVVSNDRLVNRKP